MKWIKIPVNHEVICEALYNEIDTAIDRLQPMAYVFTGAVGTGKSELMKTIFNACKNREDTRYDDDCKTHTEKWYDRYKNGIYQPEPYYHEFNMTDMVSLWRQYYSLKFGNSPNKGEEIKRLIHGAANKIHIFIDDLGAEIDVDNRAKDFTIELISEMYKYLIEKMKAGNYYQAVLTTNLTTEMMREVYGERTYDRLIELFKIRKFTGKSFRWKNADIKEITK